MTNPTPPNNIFFQLLTRSNNQQHSLQSENQNLFRVDEEATSVIMQYQRVLQEFKAEQFKKDPFSGLVLSNELLPKNQDGIGIVEERIKKNWERKKLVKRDWLDEDFELYKLASLIYVSRCRDSNLTLTNNHFYVVSIVVRRGKGKHPVSSG